MIAKHTCVHQGQDSLHGQGRRVFNMIKSSDAKDVYKWRCTVCSGIITAVDKTVKPTDEKADEQKTKGKRGQA